MDESPRGLTEPLDFSGEVPVYEQIARRIRAAIARNTYAADAQLPSVRELAQALLVNPNTIVRVYRELELAGFLYTRPGKGVFVALQAAQRSREQCGIEAETGLRTARARALEAGLSAKEINALWRKLQREEGKESEGRS